MRGTVKTKSTADPSGDIKGMIGSFVVLAAAIEVIGYIAGDSWNPFVFFAEAHVGIVVLLSFLSLFAFVTTLGIVMFAIESIRGFAKYRAAIVDARAQAGKFGKDFETALKHRSGRLAALAEVGVAQTLAGETGAANATWRACYQLARNARGLNQVERFATLAVAMAQAGRRAEADDMFDTASRAARLRSGFDDDGGATLTVSALRPDPDEEFMRRAAALIHAARERAPELQAQQQAGREAPVAGDRAAGPGLGEITRREGGLTDDQAWETEVQSPLRATELKDRVDELLRRKKNLPPHPRGERVAGAGFADGLSRSEGDLTQDLDPVDCTVFAPPSARQGDALLVQVFVHMPEHEQIAIELAREFSDTAQRRGHKSLGTDIPRGTTLTFDLLMPGLEIDEPVQSLAWRGRPESVQFGVTVPNSRSAGTVIGTVVASIDSIPIGHIKFQLRVDEASAATTPQAGPVGDDARVYTMAFCSYASEDRDSVVPRLQILSALGIRYFQDILDLDPGDRWEQKLYERIEDCDLFLLFWSSNAKRSKWVRREAGYALNLKGGNSFVPPEIRPIILEGPPVVAPWEELSDLHFNDRLVYVMPRTT